MYKYTVWVKCAVFWYVKVATVLEKARKVTTNSCSGKILCRLVLTHFKQICALLGYYASLSGNPVPTFRDNLLGPIFKGQEAQDFLDFLTIEDLTDRFSRNFDTELPLYAA
jgi:hypothetical protein